jgi:hypothetical protein
MLLLFSFFHPLKEKNWFYLKVALSIEFDMQNKMKQQKKEKKTKNKEGYFS